MPPTAAATVAGVAAAIGLALFVRRRSRRSRSSPLPPLVYELKGEYYQVLGHAWDHESKDFRVVYRPLYHCRAAAERFEAHVLAISTFARWESKFARVDPAQLPDHVQALLLEGPFWADPRWPFPGRTEPCATRRTPRSSFALSPRHPTLNCSELIVRKKRDHDVSKGYDF